jgi:hypothetical protein
VRDPGLAGGKSRIAGGREAASPFPDFPMKPSRARKRHESTFTHHEKSREVTTMAGVGFFTIDQITE